MKKMILRTAAGVLFAGTLAFNFGLSTDQSIGAVDFTNLKLITSAAQAQGEINPACPNGCVEGAGGCYCYTRYKNLREYRW